MESNTIFNNDIDQNVGGRGDDVDNNSEYAMDLPEMRSVVVSRVSAIPPIPSRSSQSFAIMPPKNVRGKDKLDSDVGLLESWNPNPIPKLPDYYPLERSHVILPRGFDVHDLVIRLTKYLQENSILASFHDNKATCETHCHLHFHIKLFLDDDLNLIVEVQRRSGCAYTFHCFSRDILRVAKAERTVNLDYRNSSQQRTIPFPPLHGSVEHESILKEAVNHAFALLASTRIDSQRLGMQCLLQLSDQKVCFDDRLKLIMNIVISKSEDIDSFSCMMRRDALKVLANAFLQGFHAEPLLTDEFFLVLIAKLNDSDLHSAHQAARILISICKYQKVQQRLTSLGVVGASALAEKRGSFQHKLLEREARLLKLGLEG